LPATYCEAIKALALLWGDTGWARGEGPLIRLIEFVVSAIEIELDLP
jgi:hypothetical protein